MLKVGFQFLGTTLSTPKIPTLTVLHLYLASIAGLPLLVETFRALGLPQLIEKHFLVLGLEGKYR